MELNLDNTSTKLLPVISRLVVHDDQSHPLFSIEYDQVTEEFMFRNIDEEEVIDLLIQSKSTLTHEKGVEAFGTFVAGASIDIPQYKHFLSLYIPSKASKFTKYHLTLDSSLEHINLEGSLLLAAESYAVLYDPLQHYLETQTIELDNYPLLTAFFRRSYSFEPFNLLLHGTDLDGSPLQQNAIVSALDALNSSIQDNIEYIDGIDLLFMTISGAIMAQNSFLSSSMSSTAIEQISHSMVSFSGMFTGKGSITLWFPFTKNKVGKINRAIGTTLNTLNYASSKRNIKDQVQTNIAHKFHDLVDVVATEISEPQSFGLQTNVGYLVCSIGFKAEFQNDMTTILQVSQQLSSHIKVYGQTILSYIAKSKQFDPITF